MTGTFEPVIYVRRCYGGVPGEGGVRHGRAHGAVKPAVARASARPDWRTRGFFSIDDAEQLERLLSSMPLQLWLHVTASPLAPHPSDLGI